MPLVLTPGQFARKAEFYYQLGQLTSAGLGLVRALEQLHNHPPTRSYRRPIGRLLEHLAAGHTLADSLNALGVWLPAFDRALLRAGEESGRLDQCFKLLADYYNERARLARQVIADLLYPVFLFHFAIFIIPFAKFFSSGDLASYLSNTLGVLIPIYLVIFGMIYATQSRHGETWRSMIEGFLHPIPILGTARHYLALGRLAFSLEALLSAGVSIIDAWELAATASGSPALKRTVLAWRPQITGGVTPAEAVSRSSKFPQIFASQYTSGEISGKLDETLGRLARYYQEEGSRKLHAVAQWTPRAVYLFIVFMIAWHVIQFWTGYFKDVGKAAGF